MQEVRRLDRFFGVVAVMLLMILLVPFSAWAEEILPPIPGSADGVNEFLASITPESDCAGQKEGLEALLAAEKALQSRAEEPQPMAGAGCESTCTGYCGPGACCECFCGGMGAFNFCYNYCCNNSPVAVE